MENNENKGFSIWYILGHLFMVSILSSVAIYYIYKGGNASSSDYISGAGSVASVYAILLALWQIKQTEIRGRFFDPFCNNAIIRDKSPF